MPRKAIEVNTWSHLLLRDDMEGWILDRLGLLRVIFSGGVEWQLVTCQMAAARLAGGLTSREGTGRVSWDYLCK